MTEEEVKLRLITPALQQVGWNVWRIGMEQMPSKRIVRQDYEFSDGQILFEGDKIKRGNKKKCDYVLYSFEGQPLAIIEAKGDSYTIRDGIQQAMEYAKGFGCYFAYSSNGSGFVEYDFFTGKQRDLKRDEFPSESELLARFYKGSGDKDSIQELQKQENNEFLTPRESIPLEFQNLISQPYFLESKFPRYYQAAAVNKAIEAIATGQKRILLVMATGTGKTYTAFELIYRLYKAGKIKKILYLADRNNLIDQTMANDFKPLLKESTKIQNKQIDEAYPLCFALYQQFITFKDDEIIKNFENYAKDAFDFILIDECHRSSSKEDSAYREILEYFSPAIQVGMTATPKHNEESSNLDYFGKPVYMYSLKQGIEDGFLAPYKVVRYGFNIDLMGYRPEQGKKDKHGHIVPDDEYYRSDFNRVLYIDERTNLVAKIISDFLKHTLKDRFAKTIVFCQDTRHAAIMREALINENSDLMKQNSNYIVRITGDDEVGKDQLENFIATNKTFPVIATTSKLLSTGTDTKMVKLIALDMTINSLIEFKQIVGRGTRINEKLGKSYFSILDFSNATRLFADKDFDGETFAPIERDISSKDEAKIEVQEHIKSDDFPTQKPDIDDANTTKKFEINGVEVQLIHELHQILDASGKLITNDFIAFSKQNINSNYQSLELFLKEWQNADTKSSFIQELEHKGILIEELRAMPEFKDKDEFDILISLAFNQRAISRKERAKKANKILNKFEGKAREVLEILLEKYAQNGITDIENPKVFQTQPFDFVNINSALEIFGGVENYLQILKEIKKELYDIA
ncbi:DEAD/DEAH box helicase [Helicobacter jaachi]|uniref:DEAD/DEAH box helicase n=1 Tax=Helicobacter jaachi TaxID=1677920 RepID=A0A4U8TBS9_9HELI|nr:DEAD/DEAH box helicase family protein [Helicobacter jaachi]TLD97371.1 DEAD/DEAH box helicase [Helicobacter jaachi]